MGLEHEQSDATDDDDYSTDDDDYPADWYNAYFFPRSSNSSSTLYWPIIPFNHYENLKRTFLPRPIKSWCWRPDEHFDDNTPVGMIFVKLQKASSSTLAGITLHITHRNGIVENGGSKTPCSSVQSHSLERYPDRDQERSFVFSSVRDPTQRALSYIFYRASNRGLSTSDESILDLLKTSVFPSRRGEWPSAWLLDDGAMSPTPFVGSRQTKSGITLIYNPKPDCAHIGRL